MKSSQVSVCFRGTPSLLIKWLLMLTLIQLWNSIGNLMVSANFNLFLDRREFQKLHGISSDIYYIREGVVNEYALNFVVTVPPEVDDLHFSWQTLTKRAVHYNITMEYTDPFALRPPVSNITFNGRVPHNLETFKVTLSCSGRSNSEVSVTIRMNFQVKHPKPNITTINIKRNKICLFKESPPGLKIPSLPRLFPPMTMEPSSTPNPNRNFQKLDISIPNTNTNATLLFQDQTPNLLLAGLLGGCAVTVSTVFLVFFICLRRKLTSSNSFQHYQSYSDPNYSSDVSSPACFIAQSHSGNIRDGENKNVNQNQPQNWNPLSEEKRVNSNSTSNGPILSRSSSRNSYVTIASFWNDIFRKGSSEQQFRVPEIGFQKYQQQLKNQHSNNSNSNSVIVSTNARGSDVSPYAYAHIVPKSQVTVTATTTMPTYLGAGVRGYSPSIIHWFSKSRSQTQSQPAGQNNPFTQSVGQSQNPFLPNSHLSLTNVSEDNFGHIYSNTMCTFNPNMTNKVGAGQESANSPLYSETEPIEKYSFSTLGSNSDSLVQIDGFQCRQDLVRESNVVERFL